jgi:hypothetical protein
MLFEIAHAVPPVATAIGVCVAGWQLWLTKKQSVVQFEDQMSAQYREIARRLPIEALLGEALDPERHAKSLGDFYHYFDLSNEQAFLHKRRRITKATWCEWKEGIEQNLGRPAFALAWSEITHRAPDSFNELREIVPPGTSRHS